MEEGPNNSAVGLPAFRNKQNPLAVFPSASEVPAFVNQGGKLDLAAVAARNWPQSCSYRNHTGGCN